MSGAELAARRTAAAAVLADFGAVEAAFQRGQRDRPAYAGWALRLAQHLRYVLDDLAADDGAARLEEIRAVLTAFDGTVDDRQYALEEIDRIVNGDGR